MQKKSLLVALFCGALCLTGCLKNEESASVAQVRLAKAEELKSLATLNEATAAAKLIYANAEKTVKEAEAKLIEAQAALVNAQAETEKVRADLLKVQIQLANVLVEEERVKLQMLEADLEARLAALEVEKAAADAAKQAWVNVLNDLVAQSKIDAINNTKKIVDAEAQLEDYILTLAGQKADSAKYYAGLYFKTLKDIEKLQAEELEWKALQVLVNQEAILTRDAIHETIKKNNEEIAENNALIAALKEQQSKTPEEAEAELLAAKKALEEAYTKYQDAMKAENTAKKTLADLNDNVADFVKGWDSWSWAVKDKMPHAAPTIKNVLVEVGETTVVVPTYGINVQTEAGVEFVPFFNEEAKDVQNSRYPNVTVYEKDHSDHVHIKSTVIAPASIEFDNIKEALDAAVANQQTIAEKNIAARAAQNEWVAGLYEKQIEALEEKMDLHEQYVAVRKEAVEAAEEAYLEAKDAADKSVAAVPAAWKAFQEYMLLTYPTVTSNVIIRYYEADNAYQEAVADSIENRAALDILEKVDTNALRSDVKDMFEAYAEAKGDWKDVDEAIVPSKPWSQMNWMERWQWMATFQPLPAESKLAYDAWVASMDKWNPAFAESTEEPVNINGKWYKTPEGEEPIPAGSTQDAVLTAKFNLARAKEVAYAEYINYLSGAVSEYQYLAAKRNVTTCEQALSRANDREDAAWEDYINKYNTVSDLIGILVDDLEKYYNPAFKVFEYVTFPTDALYDHENIDYPYAIRDGKYDFKKNKWDFETEVGANLPKPGEAQLALINSVKKLIVHRNSLAEAILLFQPFDQAAIDAKARLNRATEALFDAIGEDNLDEQALGLYDAFVEAKENVTSATEAYDDLLEAYAAYPDYVGAPTANGHARVAPHNFGWLISNYQVDYKSTYLGMDGKRYPIANLLYPFAWTAPYVNSMKYQAEQAQNMIDVVLPAQLAAYTTAQNNNVKAYKAEVTSILEKVDAYKPLESQYDTWVDDRNAADEAYNQAKMDTFDAKEEYVAAKADYNAAKAVVDEGVWVYDPKGKIPGRHQDGGFVKVNIAKAIEHFESENADLEAENEYYRNVLTDGETALATVNQILDEKIQTISDNIQILVAISAQYKAIMNAYLGVNEDEE